MTLTKTEQTVALGDIWRIGPHVLACGDIGQDAPLKLMDFVGEEPKLLYSDLPWSASVAVHYRKSAGVADKLRFDDLVAGVMRAAARTTGCAFIETSRMKSAREVVTGEAERLGMPIVESWDTLWNRFEGVLWRVKGPDHPHPDIPQHPTSTSTPTAHHAALPAYCVLSCTEPGDLVLDCCMGFGLVAMAAATVGRRALGTELNPFRVQRSVMKLAALTGDKAELVGRL